VLFRATFPLREAFSDFYVSGNRIFQRPTLAEEARRRKSSVLKVLQKP
jgi:hypothetical protein